jgi:hypothetical protein
MYSGFPGLALILVVSAAPGEKIDEWKMRRIQAII